MAHISGRDRFKKVPSPGLATKQEMLFRQLCQLGVPKAMARAALAEVQHKKRMKALAERIKTSGIVLKSPKGIYKYNYYFFRNIKKLGLLPKIAERKCEDCKNKAVDFLITSKKVANCAADFAALCAPCISSRMESERLEEASGKESRLAEARKLREEKLRNRIGGTVNQMEGVRSRVQERIERERVIQKDRIDAKKKTEEKRQEIDEEARSELGKKLEERRDAAKKDRMEAKKTGQDD